MRIVRTIFVGIMIVLSIIILILGFKTVSEISPLSSDYMLAQAAKEITLENNPFSKIRGSLQGSLLGWEVILLLYSFTPTAIFAFDRQERKRWLSLFWTPGILVFMMITILIGNKYMSLYDKIIRSFNNAHWRGYSYVEEIDPTPYVNQLFPLIKAAIPSLVTMCVFICICMFMVILTGLIGIASPQKIAIAPHQRTPNNRQITPQRATRFCTNCGIELSTDTKFCSNCGTKTDDQ